MVVNRGGKVNVPASRVATSHVALTTYLTDQAVSPGTHFSFVVDAVPEPRVHVYAPWVTNYQPIAIAVMAYELLVGRVPFPKSEDYVFQAAERARANIPVAIPPRAGPRNRSGAAGCLPRSPPRRT